MIWIGIDDTDMLGTPGTNQLARKLAQAVSARYRCRMIVRHQLCGDPSIPCTSKNGSASLTFEPLVEHDKLWLLDTARDIMRKNFVIGSDPGLCMAEGVPDVVQVYGRRVQREVVTQDRARSLAKQCGIHLEGLGGTEGGVIGALAAVGLAATQNDGRVVQSEYWTDEMTGPISVTEITRRGIIVRQQDGSVVHDGAVDIGKKLRPNIRDGSVVLTVARSEGTLTDWKALKLL